jgi:nucleoside-diphosphate-sugar epimerase
MKAIVVTDQAAGTAGMKLVERPEPQAARLASLSGASPDVAADAQTYAELEARVLAGGMEGIALRYGFYYGPGTWFHPDGAYADKVRRQEFPIIGAGSGVWSWVHIEGAALATVAASEDAQDERTREAFFIVQPRRAELEEIARRIDAGQVRRVVGAEFPLADAIRAYQAKPLRGKVVLRVDGDGQ